MVQILPRNQPSFGQQLGSGLAQGLGFAGQLAQEAMKDKALQQSKFGELAAQRRQAAALGLPEDITDPGLLKEIYKQNQREKIISQLLGVRPEEGESSGLSNLGQKDLAALSLVEPELAKVLQSQQKESRREFEGERAYHTQFSKPLEEKVTAMRDATSRKANALDLARDAVETGNLGFFSKDMLANLTGKDVFRTAKGAQLITAGKENLLSNMSRASARAQNMWFEQRLNSMFPKIGQSKEANLTTQEMLEGEVALDKLYQHEFDRLSEEDMDKYGYVKKDIDKRVHDAIKPKEKEIFDRTVYRLKEQEEIEKGLGSLKKQVGKNVSKGTPLTLAMAKLYKDKFGDNALAVAKKNGYYIPTLEEFEMFSQAPREFREEL